MSQTKDPALLTTEQCMEIIKHATDEELADTLLGVLDAYGTELANVDRALIAEAVIRLSR